MKVIEVLNKIKLFDDYRPNIKFKNKIYIYDNYLGNYSCGDYFGLFTGYCIDLILDDEIEIIEEENKPIEEINNEVAFCEGMLGTSWSKSEKTIIDKLNEVIRELNRLKEMNKE